MAFYAEWCSKSSYASKDGWCACGVRPRVEAVSDKTYTEELARYQSQYGWVPWSTSKRGKRSSWSEIDWYDERIVVVDLGGW